MAIDKIPTFSQVSRDNASDGHERVDRKLKAEAAPARDARVDEVSKLYEKQFLNEMVKAMRSTVSYSDTSKPSMAENIYRDQLDSQYVEVWGEQGGLGFSDIIYNELMEKFQPYLGHDSANKLKMMGDAKVSNRDLSKVSEVKGQETPTPQLPLRVEVKPNNNGTPAKVQSPWDSKVLMQTRIGDQATVVLDHGSGLKSTLMFKGVSNALQPGQVLAKGAPIGTLSPEINSFFWNINAKLGPAPEAALDL